MGINDLLNLKEYYIAAMDEIEIEQDLTPGDQARQASALIGSEQKAMRAALREIDRLKVSGDYEKERARLWEELGLAQTDREVEFPPRIFEFAKHWGNLRAGLNSPDEAEQEQFRKFYEAAQLRSKSLPEAQELISVLRTAKKKKGRKNVLRPAWLEDLGELDEIRLLYGQGLSIPMAARQVAQREALAHQDSRAKRFENLFRERMKLR